MHTTYASFEFCSNSRYTALLDAYRARILSINALWFTSTRASLPSSADLSKIKRDREDCERICDVNYM